MSLRLKVVLGIFIVAAVLVVARIGLVFKGDLTTANILSGGSRVLSVTNENPAALDSDKDGIADIDEAYYRTDPFNADTDSDGYKDGEEIASKCSPVKPRPGDCQSDLAKAENQNLTNIVTDLVTGGLYSGDLKNPRENEDLQKNLGLISAQVYLDFDANFADRNQISDLKTTADGSISGINSYLESLVNILNETLLRPPQEQVGEIKKGLHLFIIAPNEKNQIFTGLHERFSENHRQLLALEVPPGWEGLHLKLVNSTNRFATTYRFILDPTTDPIATILSFEKLIDEFNTAQMILNEIKAKADSYK